MTFECESERLVAEKAVLAFRATRAAMHAAPFGDGLAFTERAALAEGRKAVETILSEAIKAGKSLKEIKSTWAAGLEEFQQRRARFLIYE